MLCAASEYMKTLGTIASAVLVRICCLVMLTLRKTSQIQTGREKAFLSVFMAVEEVLVSLEVPKKMT